MYLHFSHSQYSSVKNTLYSDKAAKINFRKIATQKKCYLLQNQQCRSHLAVKLYLYFKCDFTVIG